VTREEDGLRLTQSILEILAEITGSDEVRRDLDVPLFDRRLLDSLGTVELIVRLSEELHLEISPADLDRATWATPRLLIANVAWRLNRTGSAEYTAQ
jgi:D-alanine--poly(phosphoribitol) ligase subunit 2